MKRAFPLADVLSVLHTKVFSQNEHGISDLVAFLTGEPKMPPGWQILTSAILQVSRPLREQLPELTAATQPPALFATEADAWAWVREMEEQYGLTVEVAPIYVDFHVPL